MRVRVLVAGVALAGVLAAPAEAPVTTGLGPGACGRWQLVDTPVVEATYLWGVSGTSSSDIWAVGETEATTHILHYDGTAWRIPPQPRFLGHLYDVVAIAPDDAWAVGEETLNTLVLHWDGTAWTRVEVPEPGTNLFLYSVDATSSSDVWAVGSYHGEEGVQPLTLRFDGSSWEHVPAPSAASGANVFYGVSAASPSDVWGAGYQETGAAFFEPLVEHWDGLEWTVVPVPPAVPWRYALLNAVSALSATDAWAVGRSSGPVARTQPLLGHWDGSGWSWVASDAPRKGSHVAIDLAMIAPDDVWMVGASNDQDRVDFPLAQHWDGQAWVTSRVDNPGESGIGAVWADGPGQLWAVGGYLEEAFGRFSTAVWRSRGC